MRPQGFIGRNFARQITKDFAVSDNPNDWLDDDIAHVLSLKGADCPGNLIIGDVAYEQWLKSLTTPSNKLTDKELPDHYAELANIATSHGIAGSSAGGEFPKFITQRQLAHTQTPHVIVKFSGADHSTAVRRWADLLACEHLALAVLDKSTHINAASSRIIHSHGRTFLEVERFDRFGDFGRKPVVSLSSLDGAFVGVGSGAWTDVAKKLVDLSILEQDLLDDILVLWWYGKLIGNTDMHFGNLSFLFDANPHQKPSLKLSPVYDMLPMLYAPLSGGEVPSRIYEPLLPLPREQKAWEVAFKAATLFWQTTAKDDRISQPFREICQQNYLKLVEAGGRLLNGL